jgi:hypothetical protein
MRGAIGSLNAAVAGSILLFEAAAQRDLDGIGAAQSRPQNTGVGTVKDGVSGSPAIDRATDPPAAPEAVDRPPTERSMTESEQELLPGGPEPAAPGTVPPTPAAKGRKPRKPPASTG